MQLPFSHEQFLAVFAAYNRAWWPIVVLLWLASAAALWLTWRRVSKARDQLAPLLAFHWAWAGVVYHFGFFRSINPAATLFGALFVIEACLLLWFGLRRSLTFRFSRSVWSKLGGALMAYALVYPFVALATGLRYPAAPMFGVPCPTAIFTAGALLLVPRRTARVLSPIVLVWTVTAGSAAFVLGIRPDLMLPVAGLVLLAYVVTRGPHGL